jgi:homocysteine S-methyltransferase
MGMRPGDGAQLLDGPGVVLAEGSVYERLRRHAGVPFDPDVGLAGLVHDAEARELLAGVHRGYLRSGETYGLPMLLQTDTWRASADRIGRSPWRGFDLNAENVALIREVVDGARVPVVVGGMLGPAGDAYDAGVALAEEEALQHHAPQAEALAAGGADLLFAATLPAQSEALGLARAMAACRLPVVLSFVVRRTGVLLDGTPLDVAIATIDDRVDPAPVGYMLNCVDPRVLASALAVRPAATGRIMGLQANTSAREPEELDDAAELETAEPELFARELAAVTRTFGLRVAGGCCGTGAEHIDALARLLAAAPAAAA